MANSREIMGEAVCLDALVANTLASFEDDDVKKVGYGALRYHTVLTDLTLGQCGSIESYGVAECTDLESVDILGTGTIADNAFKSDNKLRHLIMRGTTMSTLSNNNAFASTPFVTKEGAVYVQQNLVSTYKASPSWGQYNIFPISEYPKSNIPETVTDTWTQIAEASSDGTYSTKYDVGDVKSIVINDTTYYMWLVAKDADVLASDGTTTVPMTWLMFKRLYGTTHNMEGSVHGWSESSMRSWLSSTVFPLLPSEIRSAVKEVRKYSNVYENGAIVHDQQTADKLWIPSSREIYGDSNHEQTGATYANAFSGNSDRIMYNKLYSPIACWLRTVYNSSYYNQIGTGGSISTSQGYITNGVCFGFCI